MPENIKAYIVILVFSSIAFHFAKKATAEILPVNQFKQFKNSWLILTSFAFLTFNYWIFLFLSFLFVAYRVKKTSHPIGLYMAVIAAVPPISALMPGFGIMNQLMQVDYLVILSAGLLLVAYFTFKSNDLAFGRVKTDLFVASYLLLNLILNMGATTVTDILRQAVVLYLTYFVPYFVISRLIKDKQSLKITFAAFMIACFPAALIGFFEAIKGWLMYSSLQSALKQYWSFGGYLSRDGALRATSSFGHSIAFGYTMTIALGMYLFVQNTIKQKMVRFAALGILMLGMIAPISRGPWVGAALLVTVYLYLGKNAISNILKLVMASMVVLAFTIALPFGDKIINLIPFVGKTDSQNLDYRQRLLDASIIVISKSPLFGNKNYAAEPEMIKMIQGEKIIDLVNIYVSVLLNSGVVGLTLYVSIFFSAGLMTYKAMRRVKTVDYELFQLGRSLLSILIAIMLMNSATSEVLIVPYLYYAVIAMCVAYTQIVKKQLLVNQLNPN
ncbi:MAG: hypothetical protein B7Y48_05225 [Methylophilales bacterium 28-44-11]|jgi:hypothetical protein|nr:MAG: hypothetical protein B7Y48_05225 [Methylophilales bacterium 28-44-11]